MSETYFDEFNGVVWVQPDGPNTKPEPLLCVDLDAIDEPQGDVSTFLCRAGDGNYVTAHRVVGTPGDVTYEIVTNRSKTRSWLQKAVERRCAIPIYIHDVTCGRRDTFLNYEFGKLLPYGWITSKGSGNNAMGRAEQGATPTMTSQTFSLSSPPPSTEYYKLVTTISDPASEDEPLRDIATCSVAQCATSECGPAVDPCDELQIVADAAAAGIADGYESADNAATWTAWAAQPFAADEHICSVVCFMIDKDTERILVMRGTTDAGNPAEVGYSDDGGATWTNVDVGATNGEYGLHSGALFALDHRHIWAVTDLANVYFSDDGGLSWVDQGAPTPGASEGLWYVHFCDEKFGWAVGGFRTTPTGLLIQTTDGGEHWGLAATEPQVELATAVHVLDHQRLWVTMDDGTLWYSLNWGATWAQRVLPTTPVNLADVTFYNDYFGAVCGYRLISASNYPAIWRTIDGGFSWETHTHGTAFAGAVAHFGLNALIMCGANEIHAVGEQLTGGSSVVWMLKPAGW